MTTISEALAIAREHHQGGRLEAAAELCRRILQLEPQQADAMHLLGLIAYQVGSLDEAAILCQRAITLRPDFFDAYSNLGNTLKKQGKFDEAIACYRRALELQPDLPATCTNLGNTLRIQGKVKEAITCYRRTLELKPDFPPAHNNLGVALKEQGKLDEALECYRRALELDPQLAEAHDNLGSALKDRGQLDLAEASHRRATELKPNFPEAHNNLGYVLKLQYRIEEAIASYRRALEIKPDYALAHNNLAVALMDQGKPDDAIASYHRALRFQPEYAEVNANLGNVMKELGRFDEARAYYCRALALKPELGEVYNNLGNLMKDRGKLEEAIAYYHRALEMKPDFADGHGNLGTALEEMGDFRAAEDSFRTALRLNPRLAKTHYCLTELYRGKLSEQDVAAQRQLLADTSLAESQRIYLHFGLARVLDAQGEYAEAAGHLEQGNSLQLAHWSRTGKGYDPDVFERSVTRIIEAFSPDFFARLQGIEADTPGLESERAVFVVGLPRSGTTLVEQILASHSRVFGAGEIALAADTCLALGGEGFDCLEGMRRMDRPTASRLAARHMKELRALCPAALRIVDKMPENYLYLGLLASLLPRAKFIHCRRDLRDVAVSCWMTRFEQVRWANDQQHIASRFQQHERIMDHWRKVLPVPLLEVDYEETVADLESTARRLVAWCGLDWEPACLEFYRAKRPVSTASSVQVRQPVFRTSVDRWKHYETALGSLFAKLEGIRD